MIENQNIRQILAILVTDIVGYTETMDNDEQKGWEYLKKQRAIIPPIVSKMNGHVFKEMGDGTFSKFKSAIDAVECAIKIQQETSENNLPVRIAVHLGDETGLDRQSGRPDCPLYGIRPGAAVTDDAYTVHPKEGATPVCLRG